MRFVLYNLLLMNIVGCKSPESDEDDGFGSGNWSGGAQELPGGANELPDNDDNGGNGSGGGSSDGSDSDDNGNGNDGSSSGDARTYAGGYPTNPCSTIPTSTGLGVGNISPDWELQDQYGESVRLSDFCNSVVLLESVAFW